MYLIFFFFSSRRRHTRLQGDWSSDVCSSDLRISAECNFETVPVRKFDELPCDVREPRLTGLGAHAGIILPTALGAVRVAGGWGRMSYRCGCDHSSGEAILLGEFE